MATQAERDKIRSLQEKGAITQEQAEELLAALSEDIEDGETGGADAGSPDHRRTALRDGAAGRRGAKRPPGWVRDMADGMAAGAGKDLGFEEYDPDTGKYEYWYGYSWDPSDHWRKHGKNAQDLSRVEQPEGEDFTFKDNSFAFSRLRSVNLVRSVMKDNSFYAATLNDLSLKDSAVTGGSFSGASLQDVSMTDAEMKGVEVSGAKLKELVLEDGSAIAATKVSNGYVNDLKLSRGSRIEGSFFTGMKLIDIRLAGSALKELTVRNAGLQDWEVSDSSLAGCVIENIGMRDVKVAQSTLNKVVFRQETERLFGWAHDLAIESCTLESCRFIDCRIRDTRITGITATGLVIRGKDLTGLRLEKAEDLAALAE